MAPEVVLQQQQQPFNPFPVPGRLLHQPRHHRAPTYMMILTRRHPFDKALVPAWGFRRRRGLAHHQHYSKRHVLLSPRW